jgi:AmmeMemoRadiSam system protein B
MKNKIQLIILILTVVAVSCKQTIREAHNSLNVRPLVDTVGFAHYPWQMDSIIARSGESVWRKQRTSSPWRLAISPHDDYTYTGSIYPELLQNIKAPNLILIGVAHKAALLRIEDSLVFDTYSAWKGPWHNVEISPAREEIYKLLEKRCAIISDTLQRVEHSLEALVPFLQYFNRNVRIIPVLVPAMSPDRMKECGKELAEAIRIVAEEHKWKWGKDYAIVATTDAVHYGNEDWGGTDRALFGCDSAGNAKAIEMEKEIMNKCLRGDLSPEKIRLFSTYTLKSDNYREYKWTWCGRYSVPVALYTAYYLNGSQPLNGEIVDYSTSITRLHLPVDDIGMGRTAIATPCHWVGYAAIGYR